MRIDFIDPLGRSRRFKKWAGCNYWINQGKHPKEPIGTATSMHDCKACKHDGSCPLQKEDEVWPHNEDHDKRSTEVTNEWKRQEATCQADDVDDANCARRTAMNLGPNIGARGCPQCGDPSGTPGFLCIDCTTKRNGGAS